MKKIFIFLTLSWLCVFAKETHAELPGVQWQSNSISYLHGDNYKLGSQSRDIITYEHASGWTYGDLFIFGDFTDPFRSRYSAYGEIHPRLSFKKISGKSFGSGVVKDLLLATEIEIGSDNHRAYLYGAGLDLNLPQFQYFSVNIYVRDQAKLSGRTYQLSPSWSLPFEMGSMKMRLDGFADIDGGESYRVPSVLFVPQLMADLGHFWGVEDKIFAGAELQYWSDKYGVSGADESVLQSLVKVKF